MSYIDLLKDPRWQKKRLEIFERDNWMCQCCRDKETTLHVHHTKYILGADPWDVPNLFLITLCESCHENEERLKALDIGGNSLADFGITRFHVLRLFEHIRYRISKSQLENPRDAFTDILKDIIHDAELKSYTEWLMNGGRIDG
jgi:hypothetical protein